MDKTMPRLKYKNMYKYIYLYMYIYKIKVIQKPLKYLPFGNEHVYQIIPTSFEINFS